MPPSKRAPWKLAIAAIVCACGVAAVGGHFWLSHAVDRDVARLNAIVSSLAAADAGYADLKAVRSTHPGAWIFGTVDDPARMETLHAKVAEAFGPDEAERIVSQVRLARPTSRASGG